ncbi:MAG: TRAP transporter fused permease subunit [Deltaproteobacteria bacterium]|nr:TRAP transporter fused permease subunit [Deltaproteobacteria bacterium]
MAQGIGSSTDKAFGSVKSYPPTNPLLEIEGLSRLRTLKHPAMRLFQRSLLWGIPLFALLYNFDLPSRFGLAILQEQYLGSVLILVLGSIFLSKPAHGSAARDHAPWYDLFLTLLSFAAGGYLVLFYPRMVNELGELTADKIILGALAILLVMEACRRMSGWVLILLAALLMFYANFAYLFPGILNARGISWSKLAVHLFIDPNSLLGIPLAIAATTVVSFIVFGQFLYASGGGDFFTQLAMTLMGRFRGGAAKISVLASALFGTISGSPVANVVVDGAITIPMMVRTGYKPHVAAAVESVASNGGQLMPPVMGAAAFVMAEFLGMPYAKVALAAAIPALLYYLALFVQVDLEAGKTGITRISAADIPRLGAVLTQGWIFIIPMALIVYILFVLNLSASKAGFYAAAVALLVTFFRPEARINLKKFMTILEDAGLAMLEVAIVCAVAGIIIGVLTLTSLPFVFTLFVEQFGPDNIFFILVMTSLIALILGMGMPTTAVYVIVALTLAPAVTKLGIPPLAAHLFVFYWAMLSMITPPICIAAYAGAAIAGTSPMRTGYACMRLGIIAYVVPFVFVFDPLLLLEGPPALVALAIATAAFGTIAIGIAMVGYFVRPMGWIQRLFLLVGGIGLLIPPGGAIAYSWASNATGATICLAILLAEWHNKGARAAARTLSAGEKMETAPK